ncbi:MAG: CNNM domain-containing protein [Phycisphaerales bacterium]
MLVPVALASQEPAGVTDTPVSWAPLITYFLLAMGVSFVCSLLEATLLSIGPVTVEMLASGGKRSGAILRELKSRVDRPLIAILTTNTIANMLGAAGVGAEAQRIAETRGWSPGLVVFVAATTLTVAILLFSEIVPKSLGAAHAKRLAVPASYTLHALVRLLWPVVIALEGVPKALARSAEPGGVTREEIAALAEMGHKAGALKKREGEVIANLFAMDSVRAKDVMTPRVEMFSLERTMTAQEVLDKHKRLRYSRIPIHDGDPDTVTGMVLRYRLFEVCVRGKGHLTLEQLREPIHAVPETATLGRLLDEFIHRGAHIFLVVDEYAGTAGIVTLEDVVETLLGVDIVDESDPVASLRRLARERMQEKMRLRAESEAPDA